MPNPAKASTLTPNTRDDHKKSARGRFGISISTFCVANVLMKHALWQQGYIIWFNDPMQ